MAGDEFDLEKPARELTKVVLRGVWDWLKEWRRGSPPQNEPGSPEPARGVLIIGAGGVGKTTLARLLSGQLNWLDDNPGQYEESSDIEHFARQDDPDVEVLVAPGQAYRREADWPGLCRQIAEGTFRGIILMSAYGYHSFSTPSYKNHALWPTTRTKASFVPALLADRRTDELRVLQQLVPFVSVCKQKLWFLSVVAKQDLWASKQGEVEEHYRAGDYATAVQGMAGALGSHAFRHDFAFVSLILKNLETRAGEELQRTASSGYDMSRLADAVKRLVGAFEGIRAWEGET